MNLEANELLVDYLGRLTHPVAWQRMRNYTDNRDADTPDALWVCEHPPVFTLGQAGRAEHVHDLGDIPLVPTDRGGQVTYHGPGQIIVYTLIDLRRRGLGIRDLVSLLENAVIELLARHEIVAVARSDAPGVYVDGAKIAALGLRVRRGCSYHGVALNADIDLAPFARIDPCGYRNMAVTRTQDLGVHTDTSRLAEELVDSISSALFAAGKARLEGAAGVSDSSHGSLGQL